MSSEFLGVPEYEKNHEYLLRKVIRVLSGMMQGKTNNTGSLTLTANSATTTITFPPNKIGQFTVVTLQPTTSNAAGALSSLYVSSRSVANHTVTFTHANTASTDRVFNYVLTG